MVDIYLDSKRIKKNDLYISLKGLNNDGILYLDEVIEKGGNLLYSDNLNYSYYPNLKKDLNNILINHYKVNFNYKIIGITGTNKKTSTAYLLTKALNKYGYKAKCISTIIDNDTYYSSLTTPRNDDLIRIFKKAELENLDFLIMEVSSIGIDEFRVNNIKFDLGVLTNLESDHLDYHNDVFSYHLSKIKFIEKCEEKVIGINKRYSEFLKEILSKYLKIYQINEFLNNLPTVPGREEIIYKSPLIILDYAHTSSALSYILSKYKKTTKNKLICVIGAGGNRDKSKRKEYGKLLSEYSDITILTSDNPRFENPEDIIDDITVNKGDVIKIVNRENAIKYAISVLNENDTLLVLGKGDEDYIEIKGIKFPFKDKDIILKYIDYKK